MDVPSPMLIRSPVGTFRCIAPDPTIFSIRRRRGMRRERFNNRWTDLTVLLRAARAVKQGEDLYKVTDAKGLHYHYPPLLAIMLMPLADPRREPKRPESSPSDFGALWYVFSVAVMVLGFIRWRAALEEFSPVLKDRSRRGNAIWWAL